MELLIAVINDPDRVIDILDELYKVEVKGATVIESKGMAHIMADFVPFFSRFAEFGSEPAMNNTIFVAIDSKECLQKAIDSIEKVVGDLNKPNTGIVMSVPINFCKGLIKTEGNE